MQRRGEVRERSDRVGSDWITDHIASHRRSARQTFLARQQDGDSILDMKHDTCIQSNAASPLPSPCTFQEDRDMNKWIRPCDMPSLC